MLREKKPKLLRYFMKKVCKAKKTGGEMLAINESAFLVVAASLHEPP